MSLHKPRQNINALIVVVSVSLTMTTRFNSTINKRTKECALLFVSNVPLGWDAVEIIREIQRTIVVAPEKIRQM